MKIVGTSVFVDDQQKALEFYTEKLGFVKKADGTELLLEPSSHHGRLRRHLRQPHPDGGENGSVIGHGLSLTDDIQGILEREVSRPPREEVFERVARRSRVALQRPVVDVLREERPSG